MEIDPAPERVLLALVTSVLFLAVLEAASVATCLTGPPAERLEVAVGGTVTYSVIVAICASACPVRRGRRRRVEARILMAHFALCTQYNDERETASRSAKAFHGVEDQLAVRYSINRKRGKTKRTEIGLPGHLPSVPLQLLQAPTDGCSQG